MKAKVLSVLPPPDFGQVTAPAFEVAQIQNGLSDPGFVTIRSGAFKPGDEIDVEDYVLRPEADSVLMQMARELYANGTSRCEQIDDDWGRRNDPKDYIPHAECDDTKASHLKHLWSLMKAAGRFDLRTEFVYFELRFPDDTSDLYAVFELGHAVSEYQWKIRHEQAALDAYTANQNRIAGLKAASRARTQLGRQRRNIILSHAKDLLNWHPNERWTNTSLAERVLRIVAVEAEENEDAPELDMRVQRARKIISELRKAGKLPDDAFCS